MGPTEPRTFAPAAVVAPLVGIAGEESALPMGIAIVGFVVLAAIAFFTLTRNRPAALGLTTPEVVAS